MMFRLYQASHAVIIAVVGGVAIGATTARAGEEIRMWISTSVGENIISKIGGPFQEKTGIKIVNAGDNKKISGPQYFKDVVDGNVEAATNSQNYEDWVKEAKSAGVTDQQIAQITQRLIGHDLIKIYCNKANGLKSLSSEQIEAVFVGTKKNWKELGGADLPIRVVFPRVKVTTHAAFRKAALRGKEIGAPLINAKDYEDMIKLTAATPGACTFGGHGVDAAALVTMDTPRLGRPSILITKGKPSEKIQKLIEFIRTEGPKYGIEQ